jgi:peroxiredoxin
MGEQPQLLSPVGPDRGQDHPKTIRSALEACAEGADSGRVWWVDDARRAGRRMDPIGEAQQDHPVAPLPVGRRAPDFTLPQTHATRLALHNLLGQPVVLVFYPLDWEPLSRDQLVLYQQFASEIARLGAQLLGISIDSVYCHAAFAREAQLRFPLLADFQPRGRVARLYGVYQEHQGMSARALFVLDRQGHIRFSHAYPDFLNPGVDDLLTTLETLAGEKAARAGQSPASSQVTQDHPPPDARKRR